MLCFLSKLLQHPREAQAEREQDTTSFPLGERNAAAEDSHIRILRCCQRKHSSIPQTCLPLGITVNLGRDQAQPERWWQGRRGGVLLSCCATMHSSCGGFSCNLQPLPGNPWRKSSSRAIAHGDARERSGSDKMTLRVWHCGLPQNHVKMTRSYQI